MGIVTIIGRPNVGKSSLFNRLLGKRSAIVDDFPGVTRDRLYGEVTHEERNFYIVDTGGIMAGVDGPFADLVKKQVDLAMNESNLLIFVIDGREGITPMDEEIATLLRKSGKPIILVMNKLDNPKLLEKLAGHGWQIQRVAVGGQADGLAGLRRCYRRVGDLLAYGRDILPHTQVLTLNRYRLPVMLWRHRNDDALDELLNPLRKVLAKDGNGQLLATLRSWCEHDGQSQACADALGIHRNSLRYRMERIAELSGVDPLTLDGMLALYLGVQLLPQDLSE